MFPSPVTYPLDRGHRHHVVHDDVIKWNHFSPYRAFVRGIHRWPVDSPDKGQWRGALMFSLVASLMSLMASLVTTSRMQQCFNVLIDIYHEFLLLFYCCVLLEIKLTTTTTTLKCGWTRVEQAIETLVISRRHGVYHDVIVMIRSTTDIYSHLPSQRDATTWGPFHERCFHRN